MNSTMKLASLVLVLPLLLGTQQSRAGISLSADEAPVDPPWTQPANLSLIREKGTNTITADFVLKYRTVEQTRGDATYAKKGSYAIGVYLHRDNTADAQKNDRGIQVSYSGLLAPDWNNAGAVVSLGYSIKASTGKGLVEVEPSPGAKALVDKTKNRIVVGLGGYVQPSFAPGSVSPKTGVQPSIFFVDGGPSLYLDESRGEGVAGTGRLSGVALKLGLNFAPFGLEPLEPMSGLAVIPTFRVSAQTQHDISASGSRTKANRNLYNIEIALLFAKPETAVKKLVPSLTLSRSVGSDVLVGRKQSAKTELTFGVTF